VKQEIRAHRARKESGEKKEENKSVRKGKKQKETDGKRVKKREIDM
jgi:hypothetical protein